MTQRFVNTDRQMIPRWRESSQSFGAPDLLPLHTRKIISEWNSNLDEKIANFNQNKSLGNAAELANAALFEDRPDLLVMVSDVILDPNGTAPALLQDHIRARLASEGFQHLQNTGRESPRRDEVARIRRHLAIEPRNPVLLMDLARLHAADGHREKAEKIAHQAVALSPNNRWILRSTSRLLIAHDEFEAGHRLLTKAVATPHDPWLISAELAAAQAARRPPKFWRQAQSFLDAKALSPIHLSELASAVATIDLHDGKVKKAKERFLLSLRDPTENSLAQLKWAELKIRNGFHLEELISKNKLAYEAAFRSAYMNRDMERALILAQAWVADEPFAPEPVANVTYVASLLDDYETAIRSTEREFRLAGSKQLSIINNRVYALLSSGKAFVDNASASEIEEWISIISRIFREARPEDISEQVHSIANLGLLFYRSGDSELGRKFYEQASELTKNPKARQASGTVLCYHAREAIISRSPWAQTVLEQARNAIANVKHPGSLFYFEKIEALAKAPHNAAEILSRSSAEKFKATVKKVVPSFRVEKTDQGLVLWVPHKIN